MFYAVHTEPKIGTHSTDQAGDLFEPPCKTFTAKHLTQQKAT